MPQFLMQNNAHTRDKSVVPISAKLAAQKLSGEASGNNIYCPGPMHSKQDRSLSVLLDDSAADGFLVHSFADDNVIACRDHVRERLGLTWARRLFRTSGRRERTVAVDHGQDRKTAAALRIWHEAIGASGTVVEQYLASRRLSLDDRCADVIRYHRDLQYDNLRLPAMICLLRDVATDEPCGIHRTFLDASGNKVDRRMLGRAKRAGIKLDANDAVTTALAVGEGIETCLAARQLGYQPAWALASAGAVADFPVLPAIEVLTILAEDDGGANARAVEACGRRWADADREVFVATPPHGDMNDAIGGGQ